MQPIEDLMAETTPKFVQLLQTRLGANVPTTEDSIRYTFFVALYDCGVKPEQIILEDPYQSQNMLGPNWTYSFVARRRSH